MHQFKDKFALLKSIR